MYCPKYFSICDNFLRGLLLQIFAYHGYPTLIHELTYFRHNHNIHVHGYEEEGTITTSFDMKVQNKIDRYHLVMDALKYLPQLGNRGSRLIQWCKNKLVEHKHHIAEYGEDLEEGIVVINHTIVNPAYRGQGIALQR